MRKNLESTESLVQISKLYYEKGLTQQEIADKLNISRPSVVRLLNQAKLKHIVQIRVVNPLDDFSDLERALCKKYNLFDAAIIPTYYDHAFHLEEIGAKAADTLLKFLKPTNIVGVGWGKNVFAASNALPFDPTRSNIEWVPLAGGFGYTDSAFKTNDITANFQSRLGGRLYPFNVPAFVDNSEIRDMIMSDTSIAKVWEKWQAIDIAILGIGIPETSRTIQEVSKFSSETGTDSKRAVGELVANCYDENGEICQLDICMKRIGISYELLKNVPLKIGVAAEANKLIAIYTAIKYGLINVLVTNQDMAEKLLNHE